LLRVAIIGAEAEQYVALAAEELVVEVVVAEQQALVLAMVE
jgi:hypothetical protein